MSILSRLICFAALLGAAHGTQAVIVDLRSGTTGTVFNNQSFNETRGLSAVAQGSTDLSLTAMRLDEFNIIEPPDGTVGARVYTDSGALIASNDVTVATGFNQSVTIPIAATLGAGSAYRFAFFISNGVGGGSGDIFDPDPPGLNLTPYTDSTGLFQVTNAWSIAADAFPVNSNAAIPLMFLQVQAVPEASSLMLLVAGLLPLALLRSARRARRC
jgi:hypothetical protein